MRTNDPGRKLGFRWYCNICHTRVSPSPVANTFLSRVRIDFSRVLNWSLVLEDSRIPSLHSCSSNRENCCRFLSFLTRGGSHNTVAHDAEQVGGPGPRVLGNEWAEETVLDDYTTILMATQVYEAE